MTRRDPFREIEQLFDRMGREFEELGGDIEASVSADVSVDVAEDDEHVIVTADLPGYDREDIDVELQDESLTIAATHETEDVEEETDDGLRYHHRERRRRAVSRRLPLPAAVEREDASATYNNGVLTVTLPKRAAGESGGHSIDVN